MNLVAVIPIVIICMLGSLGAAAVSYKTYEASYLVPDVEHVQRIRYNAMLTLTMNLAIALGLLIVFLFLRKLTTGA